MLVSKLTADGWRVTLRFSDNATEVGLPKAQDTPIPPAARCQPDENVASKGTAPATSCTPPPNGDSSSAGRVPRAIVCGGLVLLCIGAYNHGFWAMLGGIALLLLSATVSLLLFAIPDGSYFAEFKNCGFGGVFFFIWVSLWMLGLVPLEPWPGGTKAVVVTLPEQADAREITEAYRPRVALVSVTYKAKKSVLIFTQDVEGGQFGSGLLVANGRTMGVILTNKHVISPPSDVTEVTQVTCEVKFASENTSQQAHILAFHETLDLALLKVDRSFTTTSVVPLADRQTIQQGEAVVALGNPLGIEFSTTEGIVSKSEIAVILTSCPINPGNSGGPLILKRGGLVAGINTATRRDAQNFNLALCADEVLKANSWRWLGESKEVLELLKQVPLRR